MNMYAHRFYRNQNFMLEVNSTVRQVSTKYLENAKNTLKMAFVFEISIQISNEKT